MLTRFTQEDLNKEFDVIVIGGGINGCGIARDAADRGLSVLLLEKEDFGYGCTSASTRLIHGGLRYLESFDFGLVRESLREREILLKNASHLVKPLQICIPIFKESTRSFLEIKAGMFLYDLLSFDKTLPSYKAMSKKEFFKFEPYINSDNLIGAVAYYDAQVTFPERICVENILMASKSLAKVLNHTEVINIKVDVDKITELTIFDKLSGGNFIVRGKQVVNVSGPWVDRLCNLTGKSTNRKVGGTKGTHIVINRFVGAPSHAIYAPAKSDNRPFFILPWNGLILIGTTDTHYEGDLDLVNASDSDVDYLISETNNLLANYKIQKKDILYTYSGIRPLPYVSNTTPGSITRKHIVFDHVNEGINNLVSIIGGKLTTYRSLSEEVVDHLFKKLNIQNVKCGTKTIPFLKLPIPEIENYNPEEEYAYTVSDVLLRRTFLGLESDCGISSLDRVSKLLKEKYKYNDEELRIQVDEYKEVVRLRSL